MPTLKASLTQEYDTIYQRVFRISLFFLDLNKYIKDAGFLKKHKFPLGLTWNENGSFWLLGTKFFEGIWSSFKGKARKDGTEIYKIAIILMAQKVFFKFEIIYSAVILQFIFTNLTYLRKDSLWQKYYTGWYVI